MATGNVTEVAWETVGGCSECIIFGCPGAPAREERMSSELFSHSAPSCLSQGDWGAWRTELAPLPAATCCAGKPGGPGTRDTGGLVSE